MRRPVLSGKAVQHIEKDAPTAISRMKGAPDRRLRPKSIIGGSTRNLVEWLTGTLFQAHAVFRAAFLPGGDRTAQLLGGAAIFAVGFPMRPIGAWIMGVYADRKGRKAGPTLSVTLMCAGSLLIAVTSGYETIAMMAPALLVIARLMQGLPVDDEYGVSATYLSEMAGKNRRGSCWYVTGMIAISPVV